MVTWLVLYGLSVFNPIPNLRVSHGKQLVQPFARTSAFFTSFSIRKHGTPYLLTKSACE